MRLVRALADYLIAQRQMGLSVTTLRQYSWHLERMVAWLVERGVHRVGDVDRAVLRTWGAGLYDGWSSATVRQGVAAARSFFKWCSLEGIIGVNVGEALRLPRVRPRVQRTLSADEIRRMLRLCDPATLKGCRDAALVNLLVDTGLRASEVCRVRLRDVDLGGAFLVVVVKGGNQERVFYGACTVLALGRWIDVRRSAAGVGTLFVSVGGLSPGGPLTTRGLRSVVRRLGESAGVEGVSPHAFRRAFACIATAAGAPSRVVQQAGRWSDIRMVERYTSALRGELYGRWSPADVVNSEGSQ